MRRVAPCCLLLAAVALLSACNEMQYYSQSVRGHLYVLDQAQDIEQLLAEGKLDAAVRDKLVLVTQAREFAGERLALSFNDSYTQYVDLQRDYVVQNLYAAPEFSTQLYSWCYPVIGCANYRGYFDTAMLQRYRDELEKQGYETYVAHVTAYSTLGWFPDPVLNTFVALPDYRLVGLVFHELAHQQLYIDGDTAFNESFATAVEQAGLEQFYASGNDADQLVQYRAYRARVNALVRLAAEGREALDSIYQQPVTEEEKRQQKAEVIERLDRRYAALTNSAASSPSTAPSAIFNNARLGAMAAYHQYVPAFLHILASHNRNFPAFYAHVSALGELAPEKREQCLLLWAEAGESATTQMPTWCSG
ncbi:MAG: aminopeptidase [Halioglobus sp.]|nr:aminopeptidase [Halioglobus sp.]